MRKKYAFVLSVLFTLVLSNLFFIVSISDKEILEQAIVARVIDGDTLELEDGRVIRLSNINSPEKSSPLFIKSSDYLKRFVNESIFIESLGSEKYGRVLARIYSPDMAYINLDLVQLGLASKFLVEKSELSLFDKAENLALENNRGIWQKSDYFECISLNIFPENEFVELINNCPEIDLSGWILKDESRKQYKFNITLKSKIKLHSGQGQDNITDIFWNAETNIWNNDRDTAYLFDSEEKIAYHKSYGY